MPPHFSPASVLSRLRLVLLTPARLFRLEKMPRPARKSVSTVSYADAASDSSDGEARTSSRTANTSKNSKSALSCGFPLARNAQLTSRNSADGTKPRQSTGRDAGEVTDGRMLQDSGDTRLDSSSSDESSDEDDYEATVKRKKRKTGFLPQVPQGQVRRCRPVSSRIHLANL